MTNEKEHSYSFGVAVEEGLKLSDTSVGIESQLCGGDQYLKLASPHCNVGVQICHGDG